MFVNINALWNIQCSMLWVLGSFRRRGYLLSCSCRLWASTLSSRTAKLWRTTDRNTRFIMSRHQHPAKQDLNAHTAAAPGSLPASSLTWRKPHSFAWELKTSGLFPSATSKPYTLWDWLMDKQSCATTKSQHKAQASSPPPGAPARPREESLESLEQNTETVGREPSGTALCPALGKNNRQTLITGSTIGCLEDLDGKADRNPYNSPFLYINTFHLPHWSTFTGYNLKATVNFWSSMGLKKVLESSTVPWQTK